VAGAFEIGLSALRGLGIDRERVIPISLSLYAQRIEARYAAA
jgi:hypothetical protein